MIKKMIRNIVYVGTGAIALNSLIAVYEKNKMKPYGYMVNVDGEQMCVDVQGNSKDVIVILSGYGCPTPVMEFQPLIKKLKTYYTVVTVECFGYGLSSKTKKPRTIENITKEIHTALQALHFDRYFIMAHSLSGIYSIYYANRYPEEVRGFIGIDTSTPNQNKYMDVVGMNEGNMRKEKVKNITGINRLKSKITPDEIVSSINGYQRPKEEFEIYRQLTLHNMANDTVMSELVDYSINNMDKTSTMKFPDSVPVLFLLASQSVKSFELWPQLHQDIFGNNEFNQLIQLEGTHYLHFSNLEEVYQLSVDWINKTTKN